MPCLATVMEHGTAFMCSTELLPSLCACGAAGVYLCDWPEMRWERVPYSAIQVGDVLQGGSEIIFKHWDGDYIFLACSWKGGESRKWAAKPDDLVSVYRSVTCDQACCEAHVREVDDERHYCREHWSAWEIVQ